MRKTHLDFKVILLAIAGFLIVVGAISITGAAPFASLQTMFTEALATPAGWRDTLKQTTPLLILGAAVFLALKAGLFNIGADGQFVIGSLCAVTVGLNVTGPFGLILGIIAGAIGGALWALPAGLIKAYRGGHEVITTIMLNSIAGFLVVALVKGPLQDPTSQSVTTSRLDPSVMLPTLINAQPFRINLAFILALIIPITLWFFLKKTVSGYELLATGANPKAAETAGIPTKRIIVRAMTSSGLLSGLAGALYLFSDPGRFYSGFSPGFGFDALGVALLAGASPLTLFISAFVFGALAEGTSALSLIGVPKGLNGVLLGILILVFAAIRYRKEPSHE